MNISIRNRIFWSFFALVLLFVISAFITIYTISSNKKLSAHLTGVIDPSLQRIEDFEAMLTQSKMYTTNWVFLRSNTEDKMQLEKLHSTAYKVLKLRLQNYSSAWVNKNWVDSLNKVFMGFENVLAIERNIMSSLKEFNDYDDPVTKLEAERKVEEEILPRTAALINELHAIHSFGTRIRTAENIQLERSSVKLRTIILVLAIIIIGAGVFLSVYMARVIIEPINKIKLIINDLGKGIIRTLQQRTNNDEIGEMTRSVNNLSEKLSLTTAFANEIGNRNFDTWYEPLSEEDTLGRALITMRDNLKASDANLEINTKELESKNRELEQFAYVASHDLQEPLRTTSSFVELLQKQYYGRLDEKADKYLSYILQASDRMKILISDLLDYSRIGHKKKLQKVDCNLILQEVFDDLGKKIKDSDADVRSDRLPVIQGFPTEIKQLFQNLIVNAIKFRKKDQAPQVAISVSQHKQCWNFAVRDNGIGIDPAHASRIFIIFQRLHTRTEYEGSGIGLSHCKKIVELHKGKIWVESIPGTGSTFHFTIPQNTNS